MKSIYENDLQFLECEKCDRVFDGAEMEELLKGNEDASMFFTYDSPICPICSADEGFDWYLAF